MSESGYKNIKDIWPVPPTTMIDRLRQVLDVWGDYPDDFIILIATIEVYGPHISTGLTVGDLKELYGRERLGADTVMYGSAADRLRDRLRKDVDKHGPPPGDPNQP
jgi:hypothetical protein